VTVKVSSDQKTDNRASTGFQTNPSMQMAAGLTLDRGATGIGYCGCLS